MFDSFGKERPDFGCKNGFRWVTEQFFNDILLLIINGFTEEGRGGTIRFVIDG